MNENTVVFMYHNIASGKQVIDFPEWQAAYDVTLDNFSRHLERMASSNRRGAPIHITFDDGYRGLYDDALNKMTANPRIQCSGFITTNAIGKRGMLTAGEIRELHECGVQIGAHSHSHRFLENLPEGDLQNELFLPKVTLEDIIGAEVARLSLPGGRYDERAIAAAQKFGYTEIYTSLPGYRPLQFKNYRETALIPRWLVDAQSTSLEIEKILNFEKKYVLKKKCRYIFGKTAKHVLGNDFYHAMWQKAAGK